MIEPRHLDIEQPDWTARDDWFVTISGRRVFVLAPDAGSIVVEDIAHGLANCCRFAGHTRGFYSVAQHSVLVSRLVPHALALHGLLHDATEAYLGDLIRPLKRQLPEYSKIEALWWEQIAARFGLAVVEPSEVKLGDIRALATERRDVVASYPWRLKPGIEPHPETIVPLPPLLARIQFLERFVELGGRT